MARRRRTSSRFPESDPLWYKDAIVYQLHVRAFHDSDGDGIGDFAGLRQRLDYLQDLGVNTIWLLPFYPSPLKDDGYDIAKYTEVHPDYGTLQDFMAFLQEAHRRGLRVITELVVNHTSDQHPWFQRARRAKPGSSARAFYVWSDDPDKYKGTRIIFKDFEPSNWTWDPVAGSYYWHRFYSHQPDLNFDNREVRRAIFRVLDFWLDLGVDGLRLDAVPYLYEREGTSCENLPETHGFLKDLRRHVDRKYQDRMLLAEANQWPEDAVAYFGDGDECHMAFHFPVMPRLFMSVRMEDRFPVIDILQQTPEIPEGSQWAVFLRNHDELTLEMVTDEDRDYMYRVYASDPKARINLGIRRRLAPLLSNERRKIELLHALLFSLPGTPVMYYGDEIGMGDNIYLGDRNGVRTPMQWSPDRNAGFSRTNPQRLYLPVVIDPEYHYEAVNVEAQQNNAHSLLWWVKRMIGLRKQFRAFGHGSLQFLHPDNRKILAFVRSKDDERILVLANLSRFVQSVEVDLSDYEGHVPVEMFGRNPFPPVGESGYFFTLGPHTFYWFSLEREAETAPTRGGVRTLTVGDTWVAALRGRAGAPLESVLAGYLNACRWFGAKARRVVSTRVTDVIPMSRKRSEDRGVHLVLVRVEYVEGEPDIYLLPVAFASGEPADRISAEHPESIIARVQVRRSRNGETVEGVIHDASGTPALADGLLRAIARRRRYPGDHGELVAAPTRVLRYLWKPAEPVPEAAPLRVEQSNTSLRYGDRMILKVYRRLDEGTNPDLEVGRFLTETARFEHVPPVAGFLEYRRGRGASITVGTLQGFVANEGDAWRYTLDALSRFFERALGLVSRGESAEALQPPGPPLMHLEAAPPEIVQEALGLYLGSARLLGQRTAELHRALASDPDDPAFAPEALPPHFQRSLYQSVRSMAREVLDLLRKRIRHVPEDARDDVEGVLRAQGAIHERLEALLRKRLDGRRIRTHGDYHLGQVLYTGKDFVIIDFEGEPARSISERRIKRSPLRDVAGMLRSFHYAAVFALRKGGGLRVEDIPSLEPWASFWCHWITVAFLRAYLETLSDGDLLPSDRTSLETLLDAYLIEKVLYEIRYELNSRPEWIGVPLRGLLQLLGSGQARA